MSLDKRINTPFQEKQRDLSPFSLEDQTELDVLVHTATQRRAVEQTVRRLSRPSKPTRTIKIKRGLDLPMAGGPVQEIEAGPEITRVAVVGPDYVGMKPTMAVEVGEKVRAGQLLFTDKKQPGVRYTAPGAGTVTAIHRGAKRAFLSVVIDLEGNEHENFPRYDDAKLDQLDAQKVVDHLVESGLWTSLRTRPFGRVPSPTALGTAGAKVEEAVKIGDIKLPIIAKIDRGSGQAACPSGESCSGSCASAGSGCESDSESGSSQIPGALFITAIDTRPLAADPEVVIGQRAGFFYDGLRVLGRLGIAKNYLCTAPGARIPGGDLPNLERVDFAGPHPAGLPGTHIHMLHPVGRKETVWQIGYQDVIAIGKLFRTGRLDLERVVSLAGPGVARPRLVRTRLGADLNQLVDGQLVQQNPVKVTDEKVDPVAPESRLENPMRIVSGSVLDGRKSNGETLGFLGRYDLQVSVLPEMAHREMFGWISPGVKKFSIKNVVASCLMPKREMIFSTAVHGGRRAIVPIGAYERVMPLDILPTFLLKSLSIGDLEQSEALGCLELDEEDVALLTFVCPGKADYGVMLRRMLDELYADVSGTD